MITDGIWEKYDWVVGLKKIVVMRRSTEVTGGARWKSIGEVMCTSSHGRPMIVPIILDCGRLPLVPERAIIYS